MPGVLSPGRLVLDGRNLRLLLGDRACHVVRMVLVMPPIIGTLPRIVVVVVSPRLGDVELFPLTLSLSN